MALQDELILKLATLFADQQVQMDNVRQAQQLITNYFGFDISLVYEPGVNNQLNEMSRYSFTKKEYPEILFLNNLEEEFNNRLIYEGFLMLNRNEELSEYELKLLDIFDAKTLYIESVLDDNNRIFGIVANAGQRMVYSNDEFNLLHIVNAMLIKYTTFNLYKKRLKFAQNSLEKILDNTGIDIYVNDFNTHDILYVNESMAAPYGGKEKFMGNKCWQVLFPGQTGPCEFCPQKKIIDEKGNPTKVYIWDYQRAFDGSWFRVFSSAFTWIDGRLAHIVSSADITDNKKNEEIIKYLANYDSLTKLPNRRMLIEKCKEDIDNSTKGEQGYLLFFDIDGFKSINDNFGHDAGDEFLIMLGEFFNNIPMLKDSIYRNGGDEFVALIGKVEKESIRSLCHFILERFKKPWKLKKGDVFCGTSIGIACYPEDGSSAEELLQIADRAMYKVKKTGGGNILFGYELED